MFTFRSCALSIITRMANSNGGYRWIVSFAECKSKYYMDGDDDEEVADDLLNKQWPNLTVVCGSHVNINLKRHEPRTDDMTGIVCDMANLHLDWSKSIVSHSNKIRRSLLIEGPSVNWQIYRKKSLFTIHLKTTRDCDADDRHRNLSIVRSLQDTGWGWAWVGFRRRWYLHCSQVLKFNKYKTWSNVTLERQS